MSDKLYKYRYEGPVLEYDRLIMQKWIGETMAPSIFKARNNLTYQFKKMYNRPVTAKIMLTGKITLTK